MPWKNWPFLQKTPGATIPFPRMAGSAKYHRCLLPGWSCRPNCRVVLEFLKKIVLTIALLIFAATAYAGDIPEGLITNDSAKIFTATVTDINSEAVTLKVIRKIKGEVTEDEILSLPYFEFNWNTKANTDDSCVITAIDGKSYYSFKTTSTDPKALKLLYHLSMDERFEQYINDGTYERAEYKRLENTNAVSADAANEPTTNPKTNYTQYIVCGIAGTIIIALLILFNLRNISSKKC
ncbi:MAG: hypothetical protein A4E53_03359 [Pelotomaculum sp. PtaB.Bin104]|nr:MAG: hypothetical protein A4E53_03359 [Pelotomaculum sp. PtaB.Bin104]